MPVIKTEEQPVVRLKGKTMEDSEAGRPPRQDEFKADEIQSETPPLTAKYHPVAVIIPPELFSGRSPGGLPHTHLAAVRSNRLPNT